MTLAEVLKGATEYLSARGVENPRRDAELLLSRALRLARIELYTQHDRPLTDVERAAARELVQRRGRREPLAYVLGDWDFRRLTLKTDTRALVPRPETEIVVERCLELLDGIESPRRSRSQSHRNDRRPASRRPTSRRLPSRWPPRTRRRTVSRSSFARAICWQASQGRST